tara:strand:- start:1734 stop:2687 length:954 start_codon:yes stop_codon:yes gene_type:complete
MNNFFYYLVPEDFDNKKTLKTEFFIIDELLKKGYKVCPIFKYEEINKDLNFDGIIFSSLKIILKNKKILSFAKSNNIPIFWWYFDTAKIGFSRQVKIKRIARKVSIFFNKDKQEFSRYTKLGINPIWLDQGVPSICKYNNIFKYDYDIGFFGSFEKSHSNRSNLLKRIDKKFNLIIYSKDYKKFISNGFTNVKPFVPIGAISKNIAKINLVLNADYNSINCWSNRVHLMIGSGGFSLVQNISGLNDFYNDKKHCIFFNDEIDLLNKISFWLSEDNEIQRDKLRLQGFKHAHSNYSYKIKTDFFISEIIKFIKNKRVR